MKYCLIARSANVSQSVIGQWRTVRDFFCMARLAVFVRDGKFSRKVFLLLLLVIPRRDPSSFSAQSGRSLILDPGVSLSLCFSAQSRGRVLPDPGVYLSLLTCQELADSLCDLSKCYMEGDLRINIMTSLENNYYKLSCDADNVSSVYLGCSSWCVTMLCKVNKF